jgi:hypothetical protein
MQAKYPSADGFFLSRGIPNGETEVKATSY